MSLLHEDKSNVLYASDQLQTKKTTTQTAYLEQLTYSADTSVASYVLTALDELGTVAWEPPTGGADSVDGPSSAANNAMCRFDGTTGKLIKDSAAILTGAGVLSTDSIVLTTGLQLVAGAAAGNILESDASGNGTWQAPASVSGPSSATNNAVCRFDGTTGDLIKDSAATLLTDAGVLSTDSVVLTTGLQLVAGAGAGNVMESDASGNGTWQASSQVSGPGSATNNAVCRFDGTTGKLIKDSATILTDAGLLSPDSIVLTTGLQLVAGAGVGRFLESDASGNGTWQAPTASVNGPSSATNNAVCRFDSTTGDLIKNSTATLTDAGVLGTDSIELTSGLQLVAGAADGSALLSDASGNATWQVQNQVVGFTGAFASIGTSPSYAAFGAFTGPTDSVGVLKIPYTCTLTTVSLSYCNNAAIVIGVGVSLTFVVGTIPATSATLDASITEIASTQVVLTNADTGTYPSVQITGLSESITAGVGVCYKVYATGGVVTPATSDVNITTWFEGNFE